MVVKRKFKVRKQINGAQNYRVWEKYAEGDYVIGKVVGNHICQYKKNNPKVEVYDAFFADGSHTNILDKVFVLNSCGSLDKAMESVEEGAVIKVEYNGKGKLEKGPYAGKEAHQVTVSIVEEDTEDEVDTTGLDDSDIL